MKRICGEDTSPPLKGRTKDLLKCKRLGWVANTSTSLSSEQNLERSVATKAK
jgi:hypothetical protein